MPRPGVDITSRAEPLPRSAPTDTGPLFLVGGTMTGPTGPTQVRSITDFQNIYGARTNGQLLYDCVEAYFREGGSVLWISAVIGTTTFVQSSDEPSAMTRADLDTLAASLGVVDPTSMANKDEVIAAIQAAQAAEPQAAATPSALLAALDLFDKTLGPGQVAIPGLTTATDQSTVLQHCADRNRVALLDPPSTATTAAALVAAAAPLQSDTNARYGAMFAPYAVIPGVSGGTSRTVPYSVVEAGIIARSDVTNNPNVPAAGANGVAVFATDLAQHYNDTDRETLNDGGVNAARLLWGGVETYGYRTLAKDGTPAATWLSLGWARLNMAIAAKAEEIGERYVFSPIDGRGRTIAAFGGDLRAMLAPYWEQDALYGATAEDAFQVNVGSGVNTPTTIANGELHAVLNVKMSPYAEWVEIEIVKVATTQALAA